jgi:hypothetical protein
MAILGLNAEIGGSTLEVHKVWTWWCLFLVLVRYRHPYQACVIANWDCVQGTLLTKQPVLWYMQVHHYMHKLVHTLTFYVTPLKLYMVVVSMSMQEQLSVWANLNNSAQFKFSFELQAAVATN